jgi:predicted TPR repeat methyltransferase
MPSRAPDALIQAVYASRAASWGQDTEAAQAYRGAELVAAALHALARENEPLDILDAGCGTGLVGALVRKRARRLDGVDLSAAMIARAQERGLYDALQQGNLVDILRDRPQTYGAIACAATLIHFGDLRPVLEAAASALRDCGLMIFTVFPHPDPDAVGVHDDLVLAHGGCFAHGRDYIARTAEAASFKVKLLKTEVHERNRDQPRMGLVVGLRRRKRK